MYLFVCKFCDLELLQKVLGKSKFGKGEVLQEELLNEQETFEAQQVRNLVQYLRQ
jgi:hypothetical protein